jgi:hypothetical protein
MSATAAMPLPPNGIAAQKGIKEHEAPCDNTVLQWRSQDQAPSGLSMYFFYFRLLSLFIKRVGAARAPPSPSSAGYATPLGHIFKYLQSYNTHGKRSTIGKNKHPNP